MKPGWLQKTAIWFLTLGRVLLRRSVGDRGGRHQHRKQKGLVAFVYNILSNDGSSQNARGKN